MSEKVAVVLIRGLIGTSSGVRDTLHMLKLKKKNSCIIVDKDPQTIGMVKKVKDYVTWGEVDAETVKNVEKKMRKNVAYLQPPRKGFGRKGIKVPFTIGGALGYRGEKMKDLLLRMV